MSGRRLIKMFIRRNLRLALTVGLGAGTLGFSLAVIFPETDFGHARALSSSWPPLMKDVFGDPVWAFTDIHGWLHLQVFHLTLWLVFGMLLSMLASRIIAREIEGKSIDILLSCSVSRTEIMASGMLAVFMLAAMSMLPLALGCGLGVVLAGESIRPVVVAVAMANGLLLTMVAAALTLLLSVYLPYQTPCVFAALGAFSLAFLHAQLLVKLIPALEKLLFLNPFHYYTPERILFGEPVSIWDFLVFTFFHLGFSCVGLGHEPHPDRPVHSPVQQKRHPAVKRTERKKAVTKSRAVGIIHIYLPSVRFDQNWGCASHPLRITSYTMPLLAAEKIL